LLEILEADGAAVDADDVLDDGQPQSAAAAVAAASRVEPVAALEDAFGLRRIDT
jgi:hypothetical protein